MQPPAPNRRISRGTTRRWSWTSACGSPKAGRYAQRLMAAMGQLDCGQCGYLCQSYAEALAEGRETSTSLCVPGAKPTARLLKQLLAEAPVALWRRLVLRIPANRPVAPKCARQPRR